MKYNKQNIDRKTNKPHPKRTEGIGPDRVLNRAEQTRRDDDVIRTPKRTVYDIDYAIKWYIENEIQPQITHQQQLVPVPVIFANGEKWDNVQRLGYIRDEKGMLQSPLIMINRKSIGERDNLKNLDVNLTQPGSKMIYRNRYNARNRYEDTLFPIPKNLPQDSQKIYLLDIPKYVTVSYDIMMWCDFTTQLNDLVDQFLPYNRFAWGNDANRFVTYIDPVTFEIVNTVGQDRLVRASMPISVDGTLLNGQEARQSTIQKMYSIKKVRFDSVIDVGPGLFETTAVPAAILAVSQQVLSGASIQVSTGTSNVALDSTLLYYLTNLTDQYAIWQTSTTVTVPKEAAANPITFQTATKNEFDVYINGQYIDKSAYTWTPSEIAPNTIVFDTATLGYQLNSNMTIVINGRWA